MGCEEDQTDVLWGGMQMSKLTAAYRDVSRRPRLPALVSRDAPGGDARARSDLGRFLETRDGPEARNPVELIEIVKSAESPGNEPGFLAPRRAIAMTVSAKCYYAL